MAPEAEDTKEVIQEPDKDTPAADESKEEAPSSWATSLLGRRLLVVEDSLVSRSILVRILQSAGATTEEATNGYEGLALLRKSAASKLPYDAILCDIMMPEMDGYTFLEQMRARPEGKHMPVVMLTARTDKESVLFCMKHGVGGYVRKPFQQTKIMETLQKLLPARKD